MKGFDIIVFTTPRAEGPWFVGAGRRLRVSKKHEGRNLTFVPWKVGEALPTTIRKRPSPYAGYRQSDPTEAAATPVPTATT